MVIVIEIYKILYKLNIYRATCGSKLVWITSPEAYCRPLAKCFVTPGIYKRHMRLITSMDNWMETSVQSQHWKTLENKWQAIHPRDSYGHSDLTVKCWQPIFLRLETSHFDLICVDRYGWSQNWFWFIILRCFVLIFVFSKCLGRTFLDSIFYLTPSQF